MHATTTTATDPAAGNGATITPTPDAASGNGAPAPAASIRALLDAYFDTYSRIGPEDDNEYQEKNGEIWDALFEQRPKSIADCCDLLTFLRHNLTRIEGDFNNQIEEPWIRNQYRILGDVSDLLKKHSENPVPHKAPALGPEVNASAAPIDRSEATTEPAPAIDRERSNIRAAGANERLDLLELPFVHEKKNGDIVMWRPPGIPMPEGKPHAHYAVGTHYAMLLIGHMRYYGDKGSAHAMLLNVVRDIVGRGEKKWTSIETAFLYVLGEYISRRKLRVGDLFCANYIGDIEAAG